jgi:hypothetical protein
MLLCCGNVGDDDEEFKVEFHHGGFFISQGSNRAHVHGKDLSDGYRIISSNIETLFMASLVHQAKNFVLYLDHRVLCTQVCFFLLHVFGLQKLQVILLATEEQATFTVSLQHIRTKSITT